MRSKTYWPYNKETDIWHVGIAHTPIETFIEPSKIQAAKITWLPQPRSFAFIADPFAIMNPDGSLTVFVEALDYRIKRGEIHYYQLNADGSLRKTGIALSHKHHLSYPYLIQHQGETYMLPECYRSGKLTLYRAQQFSNQWEPVADLLNLPAIDASPIHFQGKWWMFFALPGDNQRALNELHLAYADDLLGPWQLHPGNPIHRGVSNSRMGGTPFVHDGALHLPMQDCSKTYGGGIRILRVDALSISSFAATEIVHLAAENFTSDFPDGMHTLSACGNITIFDAKRTLRSPKRHLIDWQRRLNRLCGKR